VVRGRRPKSRRLHRYTRGLRLLNSWVKIAHPAETAFPPWASTRTFDNRRRRGLQGSTFSMKVRCPFTICGIELPTAKSRSGPRPRGIGRVTFPSSRSGATCASPSPDEPHHVGTSRNHRHAVRTSDGADLERSIDRASKVPHPHSVAETVFGFRERIDQHAGNDVGHLVQTNSHRGLRRQNFRRRRAMPQNKSSSRPRSAVTMRPSARNNVGRDQIVERKAEATDQRSIAAA